MEEYPRKSINCPHCGLQGHTRITSLSCLKNKNNPVNRSDQNLETPPKCPHCGLEGHTRISSLR